MELLLPPAVRPGSTVAVVATSWGGPAALPDRTRRGIAALHALGYAVQTAPHAAGAGDGTRDWVSGTREERLADLHGAFLDPDVDLILSAIGGDHSAQLLDALDLDVIAAHPTAFCGYSDTTALLHGIHARTGLVTFYGPALIPELGEVGGPDAEVVEHLQRVLTRQEPAGPLPAIDWQAVEPRGPADREGRPRRRVPGEARIVLRGGSGEGPLLPGCLPSLRHLVGTPWQPECAGRVLVVETPEAPYCVEDADADLTHLRNAGLLRDLAALVVGRTDGWPPDRVRQLHACAVDAARGTTYPVLAGVECTHSAPLLTLPIGVRARVRNTDLILLEAAVQ